MYKIQQQTHIENNTELVQHTGVFLDVESDASDFLPRKKLNQTINRMLLQCLRLFPVEFTRNGLTNGSYYLAPASQQSAVPGSPECQDVFGQKQHPGGYLPALLPDFAPCAIFLFHRLIIMLKEKNFKMKITPNTKIFQDTAETQPNMTRQLQPILKQVYHTCN